MKKTPKLILRLKILNLNKKLHIITRLSSNIEFFTNKIKDVNESVLLDIMSKLLDELINDIIKAKVLKSFESKDTISNEVYLETSSFNSKIERCYELQCIGMDVRAILHQIDLLKDDFQGFEDLKTQSHIQEMVRLSHSELFELILKNSQSIKTGDVKCNSLDNLIDSIGYQATLQFIFTIIAAALVENLLSI